ncbi:acetyl-CoA C-acyltransferase [Lewinellaceae bacterium SD302]|nr:acetyl-CoA C-acyltransferase [Lewinellaceae bacterium SD302]
MPNDAYIFDAIRTPRANGVAGGALYEVKPVGLLSDCLNTLAERSEVENFALEVDDLIIGCNTPAGDQGYNIARAALLHAGWTLARGGLQINRFNTSALEAINSAAARIGAGFDDLIIAGGLECMSRVPTYLNSGPMMNDPQSVINSHYIPQGVAADLVATMDLIEREQLDEFALRSHRRALAARDSKHFRQSMMRIEDQSGLLILDEDTMPNQRLTSDALAKMPARYAEMGLAGFDNMALHRFPLVRKVNHLHTAGNTGMAADGAAICLMGTAARGKELGLSPKARIRSVAMATTDATLLTGGVAAATLALDKAGLNRDDVDLWEFNESFAAPAIRFRNELELNDEQFNRYGGSIAFGEPLGAVGGMMLCHLLAGLEENDKSIGSLTIDAGSGLALSTVIERV